MKKKPEEEEKDGFIVMFTALNMILLAFFIMMNSMAVIDPSRSRKAMNSLVGTFGLMPGFQSGTMGAFEEDAVPQDPRRRIKRLARMLHQFKKLKQPGLRVDERDDGRPVIELDAEMVFDTGGQHLAPRHFQVLDTLGLLVAKSGYPVIIEGHTDAKPMKGMRTNWYLSAARAASIQRYLERTSKLQPGQLRSVGYGSSRPSKHSKDPDAALHRRVEFVFEVSKDLAAARAQRSMLTSKPPKKNKATSGSSNASNASNSERAIETKEDAVHTKKSALSDPPTKKVAPTIHPIKPNIAPAEVTP